MRENSNPPMLLVWSVSASAQHEARESFVSRCNQAPLDKLSERSIVDVIVGGDLL